MSDSVPADIDALVTDWRERHDVPGVSLAVVDADGVVHERGYGVRDREMSAPATPDTLFPVGSVAKPVTAVAVLQLVDRGDLALDDPVREYVDPLSDVPGDPITVGELLSHTSGMPRDFVAQFEADETDEDRWSYIDGAADQRLTDRPRYMYSNSGYFLLAEILEAVDGRPYDRYVAEEVFDPLGLERAGVGPDALGDPDAATGYRRTDDGLEPAEVDHGAGASGGLVASVRHLGALLRCVLNDGRHGGERLLSSALVDAMCRRQSPTLPGDETKAYGYGWELDALLGERLVGHRGGIGVGGGYIGLLRERGLGVALAYNTVGQPTVPYGQGALALAAGADPREAVPLLDVNDAIEAVTGTYTAYRDAVTVSVERGPAGTVDVSLPFTSFTATPEAVETEPYVFSFRTGGGVDWRAEFRDGATDLVLSTGKWTMRLGRED
ncbi:serine hydrolase domain-containing protein [Halorarius halobius]|uniref:serine hydrolase domain-containing protein n=1 Tax=Halorarius halobius TaxID=2962671 RepID=UPI0020CCCF8D|nr:serine hydrolase domain-containing protein [Halorarius halobius]